MLPGHVIAVTPVVTRQRDTDTVSWEHEEAFAEVTALAELTVEVWSLPVARLLPGLAGSAALARRIFGAGSAPAQAGSIFLGAVNVSVVWYSSNFDCCCYSCCRYSCCTCLPPALPPHAPDCLCVPTNLN